MRPATAWIRTLAGAAAALWLASLSLGLETGPGELSVPEVVVRARDPLRLEASRRGVLPLEPGTIPVPVSLPPVPTPELPTPVAPPSPEIRSPGCAYRGALTSALARAAKGAEGTHKTALDRLSRGNRAEAERFFLELRHRFPDTPEGDDAAFWLGEIRRSQGKLDEAAGFYALVRGERLWQARVRQAWCLDRLGRADEALSLWQEIAEADAPAFRAVAWYRIGQARLEASRFAEAAEAFARALEPESAGVAPHASLGLGVARFRAGDSQGAEDALYGFLLRYPDHPGRDTARLLLAWILLDRGKAPEAAEQLRAVAQAAGDPDLKAAARYGLVRASIQRGDLEAAARALAEVPEGEWNHRARVALGRALLEAARAEEALAVLRPVADRDVPVARYLAGEALYALGRFGDAAVEFRRVPDASALAAPARHREGLCLLLAGRADEAATVLRRALAAHPTYERRDWLRAWLGEALYRLGDLEGAAEAFAAVPEGSAAEPLARYGEAWIAFDQRRWDEAARRFAAFLARFPEDPNRDEALLARARALYNRRDLPAALSALDRLEATAADPYYRSAARFFRGWMLARSGDDRRAEQILSALVAEDSRGPFAVEARRTLAWVWYRAGRFAKALEAFRQLQAEPDPVGAEARLKVADCLYNLERFEEARAAYRALPDGPEARFGEALCLVRLGRAEELSSAVEAFLRDYPADPRGVDLALALARLWETEGRPAEAARAYERAARAAGETARAAEARLEAARQRLAGGDREGAARILEDLALRDDLVGLAALRDLARLAEMEGRDARAAALWERVAQRSEGPERVEALRAAARARAALLEWDQALADLGAAAEACPADRPDLCQAVEADRGRVLLLSGRPDEAAAVLQRAADLGKSPDGLRALLWAGRALEAAGRPDDALETFLRIGYLYPDEDPLVREALGRAAALLEAKGEAERAQNLRARIEAASEGEGP
ncbi:tetratricopeptide repeat protein [Deferrisoma palaeochoriense]